MNATRTAVLVCLGVGILAVGCKLLTDTAREAEEATKEATTTLVESAVELPDELRVKRLVLQDDEGRERAVLEMSDGGPGLFLFDEEGNKRAAVALSRDGTPVSLQEQGEGL